MGIIFSLLFKRTKISDLENKITELYEKYQREQTLLTQEFKSLIIEYDNLKKEYDNLKKDYNNLKPKFDIYKKIVHKKNEDKKKELCIKEYQCDCKLYNVMLETIHETKLSF
jgi:uncharacterized protein YktA (UPF0223 family)